MANEQGSLTQTGAKGGTDRTSAAQGSSTGQTGVRDSTYNLISVIYHALQGAETYKTYEEDVERTQDDELAQFFRQACEDEKRRAEQGKELLLRHLQKHGGGAGGQQLQRSGGTAQQGGAGRGSQQMQSMSEKSAESRQEAVPGDQYGNTQTSSARRGRQGGNDR